MLELPIFEATHPLIKKRLDNAIFKMYGKRFRFQDAVVDENMPRGTICYASHNIEHIVHPAFNEIYYDAKFSILINATPELLKNENFNDLAWKAPSFMFDKETPKTLENPYIVKNYGVCDSAEQVFERYKFLDDDPNNKYFIALNPVRKSEQPETGGWRWHKWGSYIGNQKLGDCEYLYDEPDIELIYTYSVYKFKDVDPFLKTENFNFVQNKPYLIGAYSTSSNLKLFSINFKEKTVTTLDENGENIIASQIPSDVPFVNVCDWVESSHHAWRIKYE